MKKKVKKTAKKPVKKSTKKPTKKPTSKAKVPTPVPVACTCGNPAFGLDCICSFVAANPGTTEFTCEFCGCYQASKPRCNHCTTDAEMDLEIDRVISPTTVTFDMDKAYDKLPWAAEDSRAAGSCYDVDSEDMDRLIAEVDQARNEGVLESQAQEMIEDLGCVELVEAIVPVTKPTASDGCTLTERLDRDQTIIYLIDESYSMTTKMLSETFDPMVSEQPIPGTMPQTLTRNQCMKQAMKQFIQQRFDKYPDSKVEIIGFTIDPNVKCTAGASREDVLASVDKLVAIGGTNIYGAIIFALTRIAENPSRVGLNHIVLVTDGEDSRAARVEKLLPQFKKVSVVLDYLQIKGAGSCLLEGVGQVLQRTCNATGGEYFEVTKASDFEVKFLEMSNRLALPPAR